MPFLAGMRKMDEENLLEINGLAKIFGPRLLFKNLNFSLKRGEAALLIGANGSGKSTLLRLIAGLSKPAHGKIQHKDGSKLAFLGHAFFLYPALTAIENLSFWQKATYGKKDAKKLEEVLELVGLSALAHERTGNFSKGMSQRLNFARLFLSPANLFLLDEPFSGIDKLSREWIVKELKRRKEAGAAIFMVTHDAVKDGMLADKCYLLDKKRLSLLPDLPSSTRTDRSEGKEC